MKWYSSGHLEFGGLGCDENIDVDIVVIFRDLNASWELQEWLESAYSYVAMVDYPIPTNFMTPLPAYPIREVML